MSIYNVKRLVKSSVNGDSCFTFSRKSCHDFHDTDGTLLHYSSKAIEVETQFDYESIYNESVSDFVSSELFYGFIQACMLGVQKKRFAWSAKAERLTEDHNDAFDDAVGDAYVRAVEQSKAFTSDFQKIVSWGDFKLLCYRTCGQIYDAYTYKYHRELVNTSIDNVENVDGDIVNSWEYFTKQEADKTERLLSVSHSLCEIIDNRSEIVSENPVSRYIVFGTLPVEVLEKFEKALTSDELVQFEKYFTMVADGVSLNDYQKKQYAKYAQKVSKYYNVIKSEKLVERREKLHEARLLKRSQKAERVAENKRLREEAHNRAVKMKEEKAAAKELAKKLKEVAGSDVKKVTRIASDKSRKTDTIRKVVTDNLPTEARLAELRLIREQMDKEERELIHKLDSERKASKLAIGE